LWTGQPVGPWQKGMPQSMQRAACFFDLLVRHRQRELAKMPDAVGGRLVLVHLPVDLEKTRYLAHISSNFAGYSQIRGGCSQF
jgi:hypothetical protein